MTNWLELTHEDPLHPEIRICDPHHHLWKDAQHQYYVDEFLSDIAGNNVVSTVYVECQREYRRNSPEAFAPVGETEFIHSTANLAKNYESTARIAAGIVGFADLTLGAKVEPVLEAHLAASNRLRGIRYATAHDPDPTIHSAHTNPIPFLLSDSTFRQGVALLKKYDLVFDAWLYFPQLPELVDFAKALPDVKIVLNHTGGVIGVGPYNDRHKDHFSFWLNSMRDLSKCENVFVKLGGLTMKMNGFRWHKRSTPPSSADLAETLQPYFLNCIELFGSKRCMFESNFPIDRVSCSYTILWNAMKRISSGAGRDERDNLFHDTASSVYRLTD